MRTIATLSFGILMAGALFAQRGNFGGATPIVTGGFGNVVFPGGTSANVPGMVRTTPSFTSPLGSGPQIVIPNGNRRWGSARNNNTSVYAYPVIGGYGYGLGYAPYDASADPSAQQQQQQQQPNITVVYPPQPAPAIGNQYGGPGPDAGPVHPRVYEIPEPQQDDAAAAAPEVTHYLIAFKDHTIYSAVNYWVDGDTLHYFTGGNTHNQVSLSLVDRDLTARLNKESGVDLKLPAPKQ